MLAIAIIALMMASVRIDKRTGRQILFINILFSYAIAYCFNGALFGTMDRIGSDSVYDRTYRAVSIGFIIPSGILLLFICGNYADRIRKKRTNKAKHRPKQKNKKPGKAKKNMM